MTLVYSHLETLNWTFLKISISLSPPRTNSEIRIQGKSQDKVRQVVFYFCILFVVLMSVGAHIFQLWWTMLIKWSPLSNFLTEAIRVMMLFSGHRLSHSTSTTTSTSQTVTLNQVSRLPSHLCCGRCCCCPSPAACHCCWLLLFKWQKCSWVKTTASTTACEEWQKYPVILTK